MQSKGLEYTLFAVVLMAELCSSPSPSVVGWWLPKDVSTFGGGGTGSST